MQLLDGYNQRMDGNEEPKTNEAPHGAHHTDGFETTHWSIVLQAARSTPESVHALAELCQAYWLPLYAYARRRVHDPHKAQDLIQGFFAKLLEKNYLKTADPALGRFRAFLLAALNAFMANEWDKEQAQKRGGGKVALSLDFAEGERHFHLEPSHSLTPDQVFMRDWVRTLLDHVREQLRCEFESAGKADEFAELQVFITPCSDKKRIAAVAERLGMSDGALRVATHRLRKRYRKVLREEIAKTVADVDDVEDEIRGLFAAFES